MKKQVLFIFFAIIASLLFASTSFAAAKSPKDGVNQKGGCKTYPWNYNFVDDNNVKQSGSLNVGVCINENYSQTLQSYIVQSDMYVTQKGAPIYCKIDLSLRKVGDSSFLGPKDVGSPNPYPTIFCPSKRNFSFHVFGKYIERVKAPNSNSQTLGIAYYGHAHIQANTLATEDFQGNPSALTNGDLNGPSLIMK